MPGGTVIELLSSNGIHCQWPWHAVGMQIAFSFSYLSSISAGAEKPSICRVPILELLSATSNVGA
jgi:hypothetical protein